MADKVHLGVIGTGAMGQGHLTHLPDMEEADLTCICDIDEETRKTISEKYNVRGLANYKELIDCGLAEAVLIATPHYFHSPVGIYAMRAGLHVLVEKPIGVTIGAADELAAAARETGRVFSAMFQFRFTPQFRKALEIVESGELGEVYRTLMIDTGFRTQTYYNSAEWRGTWIGEGGGVLINQAPHSLDRFVKLGGLPSDVTAITRTRIHDIEVEDSAHALCHYPNGGIGYYTAGTDEYPESFLHEIVGENAKLVVTQDQVLLGKVIPSVSESARTNPEMWGKPDGQLTEVPLPECPTGHRAVISNFLRNILGKESLVVDGCEGTASLELSNAIYMSAMQRRTVKLPLDRQEVDEFFADLRAKSQPKKQIKKIIETDPQHRRSGRDEG